MTVTGNIVNVNGVLVENTMLNLLTNQVVESVWYCSDSSFSGIWTSNWDRILFVLANGQMYEWQFKYSSLIGKRRIWSDNFIGKIVDIQGDKTPCDMWKVIRNEIETQSAIAIANDVDNQIITDLIGIVNTPTIVNSIAPGLKGPSFLDIGYVYAPYIPITVTPTPYVSDPPSSPWPQGSITRGRYVPKDVGIYTEYGKLVIECADFIDVVRFTCVNEMPAADWKQIQDGWCETIPSGNMSTQTVTGTSAFISTQTFTATAVAGYSTASINPAYYGTLTLPTTEE